MSPARVAARPGLVWSAAKRDLFRLERNLVVAAGAGTGKTTALVELYLRLLEGRPPSEDGPGPLGEGGRPLEPDEIAVVTFTEKAARDLRRKVREGLLARLDAAAAEPEPAARRVALARWARAREAFEAAPVGTIHSYAARLLREHAVEAAIDPGFDVLDALQAETLRRESVAAVVRAALASRDPALGLLLRHLSLPDLGEHQAGLESLLAAALARLRGSGATVEGLRQATRAQLEALPDDLRRVAADIEAAAAALGGAPRAAPFLERWRALPEVARRLDSGLDDATWAALVALAPLARNWTGPGSKNPQRRDLAEALDQLPLFAWQRVATPLGEAFLEMLGRVDAGYAAARRRRHALDFDDLEELAVALLRRDVAHGGTRLASRSAVVLVDEFQDNNPRQLELVTRLAGDGRGQLRARALVVVGDPKQSIYRFRGADVSVFERMRRLVLGDAEPLRFTDNFRSTGRVLGFVNAVFARYMGPSAPGRPAHEVTFDEADALVPEPGREEGPPVEVLCLPWDDDREDRALREAEAAVRRIRQLCAGGARPGDVAVLMRTLRNAGLIERGLEAAGVPVYVVQGSGFYGAAEVRDVLCLLASLECPFDDLALAAVLRSPFAGISDDALLLLARPTASRLARPLHQAFAGGRLAAPVPPLAEADRTRLDEFGRWYVDLRARKDRTPPPDLLEEALERSGYLSACLTRPGGDQQAGNLRKLVDLARAFEARGGLTLRDFVRELEALVAEEPRETPAQVVGEGEDVVRIMTIHAAKGLEFPVVVLPGCAATWRSDREAVRFDESPESAGLAVRPLDPETLESRPTWLARRIQATADAREAAEWRRLFYVAATRAKERLVLVGEHATRKDGGLTASDTWRRQVEELLAERPELARRITWEELAAPPEEGEAAAAAPVAAGGLVEAVVSRVRWRPPAPARFAHSVTELCEFAICAHRYYLTRRLGLREAADPWFDGGDEREAPADGDRELSPVDRGRLVHAVLEHAPLGLEGEALDGAIRELVRTHGAAVPGGIAEAEQAALAERVLAFLAGETGRSLAAAWRQSPDRVLREYPIVLRLSDGRDSVVVRGALDVLWRDQPGTWTVLDYKTTRAAGGPAAARYELQLLVYAHAADRLSGGEPVRAGLAFLLDRPAEPHWIDAGPEARDGVRARTLGMARRIAELERAGDDGEAWPRIERSRCRALRCGFVGRCHGS